jgi:fructokinase
MHCVMETSIQIVAVGEILWDVFPDGPRFGGAPANFACHAAGLGCRVDVVSAVGDDELGRTALEELSRRGISLAGVQTLAGRPTGTVHVRLDDRGHASYEFRTEIAWDFLEWSESCEKIAGAAQAVCFGTLAQRSAVSRATIQRFVRGVSPSCLKVFDVNLRPPFYLESTIRESLALADILKLNDDELPILARMFGISGTERELLAGLCRTCDLDLVALTRGPRGALLCRRNGEISDQPGVAVEIRDTVGAGDAFTAVLTLGLLRGVPLDEINRRACRVAAYVCSQPGATPRLPEEHVTA